MDKVALTQSFTSQYPGKTFVISEYYVHGWLGKIDMCKYLRCISEIEETESKIDSNVSEKMDVGYPLLGFHEPNMEGILIHNWRHDDFKINCFSTTIAKFSESPKLLIIPIFARSKFWNYF